MLSTDTVNSVSTFSPFSAQWLTWLELAIIFGPHIPLLLPLVLLSLMTHRWAHEAVGLRRLGLKEERAEASKPSTGYVLFSVVCQQLLTAAVFRGVGDDGEGGGESFGTMKVMLTVSMMGVLTIMCVVVRVVPVQWLEDIGQWCSPGRCAQGCGRCTCGRANHGRHQQRPGEGASGGHETASHTQMVSHGTFSVFARPGSVEMLNPLEAAAIAGAANTLERTSARSGQAGGGASGNAVSVEVGRAAAGSFIFGDEEATETEAENVVSGGAEGRQHSRAERLVAMLGRGVDDRDTDLL
jgi:hypothetical protein